MATKHSIRLSDRIFAGLQNADSDFKKIAGGDVWLWNAPEYYLTSKIADSIGGEYTLWLEYNVKECVKEANVKHRGKLPQKMRPNGRFDIVAYIGENPIAVVEVKNGVKKYGKISDDVVRVCDFLAKDKNRESSIKAGYLAFYADDNKDNINDSLDNIFDNIEEYCGDNLKMFIDKREVTYSQLENDNSAYALCVVRIEKSYK